MKKLVAVSAIQNGTVIDHIFPGQGMRIVKLLKLAEQKKKVTLGLNLPSKSLGYKDLIKVEDREISEEEANQIAVFAPKATINIISQFQIIKKFAVSMPESISKVVVCPNERCITNHEIVMTRFDVVRNGKKIELICAFCEKSFAHDTY